MNGHQTQAVITFLLFWIGLAVVMFGISGPVAAGVVLIAASILMGSTE